MHSNILNKSKRAQALMTPVLEKVSPRNDSELFNQCMEIIKVNAEEKAVEKMQPILEAANERAKAAEAKLETSIVSRETISKELSDAKEVIESQKKNITELMDSAHAQANEHNDRYEGMQGDYNSASNKINELQNTISKLQGQLQQARENANRTPAKVIQSAPAVIPSFNVEPVRDGAGNIVSAKVIPIGGN